MKVVTDQLLLAALARPTKFRTRWQQQYHDGPTARRDAEEALRKKWLSELEALIRGTGTPMAQVLDTRADGSTILGGGRRATTLRARVRGARKYLGWLAVAHGRVFPSEPAHLTGFLEARHSEPCNRGSLKAAHQSFVFLESVAGVEEKMTTGALYGAVYKELLATAQPGRTPKQAPRYPLVVVESLEVLVMDDGALFFFRICAWWLLLQCWGTLRFDDHRGLHPTTGFSVSGNSLVAQLTRSKTIGPDRALTRRTVVVSEVCYVRKPDWLSRGWELLQSQASYPRDYLLPMPSSNFKGCRQRELQYHTAHALQCRVLGNLTIGGEKLFDHPIGTYWSPHSGRNFLPSAATALKVEKSDRDMLGGWAAQESDRYSRVAQTRIKGIQRRVAETFRAGSEADPLAESETLEHFAEYLERAGVDAETRGRTIRKLSSRSFKDLPRPHFPEFPLVGSERLEPEEFQPEVEQEMITERQPKNKEESKKRQQAWNQDSQSGRQSKGRTQEDASRTCSRVLCGRQRKDEGAHFALAGNVLHDPGGGLPDVRVSRILLSSQSHLPRSLQALRSVERCAKRC